MQVPAVAGAAAVRATLLNALGLAAGVYTLRLQVGTAALAKRVVIQ